MTLLQAIEATILSAHSDLCVVERDEAVEIWPAPRPCMSPDGVPDERPTIVAHCLSTLEASGFSAELVYRGATFVRCRA